MCLSTVYKVQNGSQDVVCEHVSGIVIGDGNVTLTDIMGQETIVDGIITSIDLMKNIILIHTAV